MFKLVNYDLTFIDYPSPTEWAIIVYFSGCSHFCNSCQNSELQKYDAGVSYTSEQLNTLLSTLCEKNKTKNIVFSGGDPLFISTLNATKYFLQQYGRNFNICIYTGYDIEFVKQSNITNFKFIKCGKFEKNISRKSGNFTDKFILASPNQNFYDATYNQLSTEGILYYDN